MNYAIVYGTRPELIKLRSVIKLMPDALLIHVGQHKSHEMMGVFQDQLGISKVDKFVDIDNDYQVGLLIKQLISVIPPDTRVICQGDTNTALAVALSARDCIHIEAGLRCGTRMIEEQNRIVIDHLAAVRFPPTDYAMSNLAKEGLNGFPTGGNTGIDTFLEFWNGRKPTKHNLLTLHRSENVDCPDCLHQILSWVGHFGCAADMEFIYPVHPRVKLRQEYESIRCIPPVDYFKMLDLLAESEMVFTDSGGLQEESCTAGIPCVTIRESTERQESVEIGANVVVGSTQLSIIEHAYPASWDTTIYGDGKAGERIVNELYKD